MPLSTLARRFAVGVVPAVVCLVAAGGALWLRKETPVIGGTGIHGIAEVREHTVASIEAGRLASVAVTVGQRVSRGQLLAQMDTATLEQQIRVADAELREFQAEVAARQKALELNGLETERTFRSDLEKSEVELKEANAVCERNHAELSATQTELTRQTDLVQRRIASAERMHELQVRLSVLQQTVASCGSELDLLENRRRATQKRFEAWRTAHGGSPDRSASKEQLYPLELRSARQQEYLRLLQMRSDNMIFRAPVDGDVVKILATTGDVLNPGNPLMVIVEAHPQQVVAYLDEDRTYSIKVGDRAILRPRDRLGAPFEGSIAAITGTVVEIPSRFWPAPARPRWGRQVFLRCQSGHTLSPGEAFDITLKGRDSSREFVPGAETEGNPEAFLDGDLAPMRVPPGLRAQTRFEPSGIVWLEKIQRYLIVSDDTGLKSVNSNRPWVFAMNRDGILDPQPVTVDGVEHLSDLESIAASPAGRIYMLASQSTNKKGVRRSMRTIFIAASLHGNALRLERSVFLYDLLVDAGRSNPAYLRSLGLDVDHATEPTLEIEGLAWHDGALFLGLKKPLDEKGQATIWKLDNPDSFFQRGLSAADLRLWRKVPLAVEERPAGISELLFLPDGSLVLAATNGRGGALFRVTEGGSGPVRPQTLRTFPKLKPEGLCLSPDGRLVVVFDEQEHNPLWTELGLPQ